MQSNEDFTIRRMKEEFQNPDAEFSMIPFWFLNDRLSREKLIQQLDDFLAKGIQGFVLHPRMGLPEDYEYLGEQYFEDVRFLVRQAELRGMRVVLYDEGMYPSGSAHGLVVRANPKFAARALRKAVVHAGEPVNLLALLGPGEQVEAAFSCEGRVDENTLTGAVHPVELDRLLDLPFLPDHDLILMISTYSRGTIRGIHFGEDDGESGAPAAADLLNPDSVKKFIEITYDRYARELGNALGSTVVAMFTDEPSLLGRCVDETRLKPWTQGFLSFYRSLGGEAQDLLALWYDRGAETGALRARYEEALSTRLEQTYYRPLSEWCAAHGIALTGHPAKSWDFGVERCFQIPGQDIVWRCVEPGGENGVTGPDSVLAKCASDAARQFGRRRNANECFGCCGPHGRQWEFSADDLKWYLDWLFVRGVNLLYPHAFFYSIAGEARRNERAPDVGPNNLWWDYFSVFSSYAKRMCWLNTDSVNLAQIAVLCGKSYMPWRCAKGLQQKQMEFNYLEQEFLAENAVLDGGKIKIRNQAYRAIVVEAPHVVSPRTLSLLHRFAENGGIVVACGLGSESWPKNTVWISKPDEAARAISARMEPDVLALDCPALRVSRLNKGGTRFTIFVNEGETAIQQEVGIRADGNLEVWNAADGTVSPAFVTGRKNGLIFFRLNLPRRESLILRSGTDIAPGLPEESLTECISIPLSGFTLRFEDSDGEIPLTELKSWTLLPGREAYSGKGIYEISCDIAVPEEIRSVQLDCGDVRELAELWVNGQRAGVRLWAPYRFEITKEAQRHIESLRLVVTNSAANRISGAGLESGLLGPVFLRLYRPL